MTAAEVREGAYNPEVMDQVLGYLRRRDYSRAELFDRLQHKGHDPDAIMGCLDHAAHQGWQSDTRFAEHYARHRAARWAGPVKIRHELRAKGVSDQAIAQGLEEAGMDWRRQLIALVHKKGWCPTPPAEPQARWQPEPAWVQALVRKGYSMDLIRGLTNEEVCDAYP